MKSMDTFDHLFFGESLKLESVWDHTVNTKFNVFYSTFTNVFYSCHVFNVFFLFFTSMNANMSFCASCSEFAAIGDK